MPIVLVELPAADAADVNVPALIAACSSGLRRGACAADEPPQGERAAAVAIVVWLDPEHLHARIEVGRRSDERAGWQVRELAFHEQDAAPERWRSVGLAIAGVVGEATLLEPAAPVVAPLPLALLAPVKPQPQPAVSAWHAVVGPSFESGVRVSKPSAGAWLELGRYCCRGSPLELTVIAGNTWSLTKVSGVATHFSTLGAGLSREVHLTPNFGLRGSLFAVLESVNASATDPASGAHASGARWLFGAQARLLAVWPASSSVSGVFGLEMTQLSGATALDLFGRRVAVSPAQRGGLQAGLEWKF